MTATSESGSERAALGEDVLDKAPLIRRLERRNWLILGALLAISIPLCSLRFTLGLGLGGAISILGFHTLQRVVRRLLALPAQKARFRLLIYHYARLGLLFGLLACIIGTGNADPLALLLGLSVSVLNLLLTTVLDLHKIRLEV